MNKLRLVSLFSLGIYLLLINSTATTADLADETKIKKNQFNATTLSFSDRQTVNNQPLSRLFQTNGLTAGGFDLASVRIKKDGKMGFNYQLRAVSDRADDLLCQSLSLELWQNKTLKYEGGLMAFSFQSELTGSQSEDWIFILRLDDQQSALMNRSCEFNFVLTTFRENLQEKGGFKDQKIIDNLVLSGRWD